MPFRHILFAFFDFLFRHVIVILIDCSPSQLYMCWQMYAVQQAYVVYLFVDRASA